LLLAGFLIAAISICPAFFLGLLALLLLVSRPRTGREWLWIALCTLALVAWFKLPDSVSQQTVRAAAVVFAGTFVALTLAGVRSLFTRTALAVLIGAIAVAAWYLAFHLRFADLQNDIVSQTWSAWRAWRTDLPVRPPQVTQPFQLSDSTSFSTRMAVSATALAALYPALLALVASLGAWLAWHWYHRIARQPLGVPAPPFREFRFNDQLIWLLLAAVTATLINVSAPVTLMTQNVVTVLAVWYWLRGLAVARFALQHASPLFLAAAVLLMFPLFAFALVGFTLVGVADTWVDFRRRMVPPTGEPA
jgi:hypothetical protein